MTTNQNPTPADVAAHIDRLSRRIRTRARILQGNNFGHNPNPETIATFRAEQNAIQAGFISELAHWEGVRDQQQRTAAATDVAEYVVPVDPMDDLNCDSCQ